MLIFVSSDPVAENRLNPGSIAGIVLGACIILVIIICIIVLVCFICKELSICQPSTSMYSASTHHDSSTCTCKSEQKESLSTAVHIHINMVGWWLGEGGVILSHAFMKVIFACRTIVTVLVFHLCLYYMYTIRHHHYVIPVFFFLL